MDPRYFEPVANWVRMPRPTEMPAVASTTASSTIESTTEMVRYRGEAIMPDPPAMNQGTLLQMLAQMCAEGWDRMAAGRNRAEEEEEEEGGWTGLQVALTSVAVMLGAKALDVGMFALYRRIVAFERTLDHEQKGNDMF